MTSTTASPLSNKAIQDYAELIGKTYEIYDEVGRADIDKLVSGLGGRVVVSDAIFAPEALTVHEGGNFEIHLPQFTSQKRDRFTIAHELGHYVLHYLAAKETGPKNFGRGQRNRAETQANVFASALLMPAAQFRNSYRRLGGDAWAIADELDVSVRAAEVRAQVLGLE